MELSLFHNICMQHMTSARDKLLKTFVFSLLSLLTPTTVAGVKRLAASVILCLCVCLSAR